MTRQEIIDYSCDKIAEAEFELGRTNSELNFYADYTRNNRTNSLESIMSIDYSKLFIAYLNAQIDDKSFSEISEDVNSFSDILYNFSPYDFQYIVLLIDAIISHPKKEKFISAFNDSNKKRGIRDVIKIICTGNSQLMAAPLKDLLEKNNCTTGLNIIKLIEYFDKYKITTSTALALVAAIKKIEEQKENYEEACAELRGEIGLKLNKKQKTKLFKYTMEDEFNIKVLVSELNVINEYYRKIVSLDNARLKKYRKQREIYSKFLNDLKMAFRENEIVDYEKIIKKIPEQEIRESFLRLVYQHNLEVYQEVDMQHKELTNNSVIHYLALLKDNDISKDEIDIARVMRNKFDDVILLLDELKKLTKDKKSLIFGLEYSDIVTAKYLVEVNMSGLLTNKSFADYPIVLDNSSNEFKCLEKNVLTIQKYNFNPKMFADNPEVILYNNELDKQFRILEEYGLIKLVKNNVNYTFLNKDLVTLLDMIIELGYIDYVLEDINILNEDNFERLYVLKAMGIRIDNREELLSTLRSDNFIVADSVLSNYIPNVVSYYEKSFNEDSSFGILEIEELKPYLVNDFYYNIGGVILSKNRVLRNYDVNNSDKTEALEQAIIKDSVLSEEEIVIISNEIADKIYKK